MKFTLITGASSGIGAMYARLSAQAGQNIILVSNQPQQLEQVAAEIRSLYNVEVRVIDIDLSAADAAQQIYDQAKQWGEVDILISNAGVLHCGQFKNTNAKYIDFITALHCTTPMKLCLLFGGDMVARGEGKILIMSSMTAWTPYPTMSLYGSTKVLLKNFAQSLWYEMRRSGVSVTTVYPGAVDTPLYNLSDSKRRLLDRRRRKVIPGLFSKFVVAVCAILPAVALLPVLKIPVIKRILDRL